MSPRLDTVEALRAVLDELEDGVALVGPSGDIRYVNRSLATMFGYDPAALIGSSVEQLVPADRRHEHRAAREDFVAAGQRRSMRAPGIDVEGMRSDGTFLPIDVQLTPLADGLVLTVVRDARPMREQAAALALTRTERDMWRERAERRSGALDDVVQLLFGVVVSLEASRHEVPEGLLAKLDGCIDSLRDALGNAVAAR